MKISTQKLAVLVRSNDALALNSDAARTTGYLTRHVLVGVCAQHVALWIIANLQVYTVFHHSTAVSVLHRIFALSGECAK